MMKRLVTAALAILCTAMVLPAFAAETLETVVVTAGRVEEKAKNVTQAMIIIPHEEIAKNQYQDMSGLLRNYGVQVDNNGAGNESVTPMSIRGMRTPLFDDGAQGGVLVLIDGRRAGTSNISMIPMISIERIEIIRGPASVQYGSSAVGGVVNVITKRGGKDLRASAEVGYGSWETWKTQAGISGSHGPLDFAGGVSWTTTDGDYKTGHGHKYHNTDITQKMSYAMNTGWTFLEEHRVGLSLLGTQADKMGSPSYLDAWQTPRANTDRSNNSVDVTYDGGYKASGLQWKARYFYVNDRSRYEDPTPPFPFASRNTIKTQGTQGQISWNKDFFTVTTGFDWTGNKYKTTSHTKTGAPYRSEYDNLGGFLLAKASLFEDKLILSGGLRYDDYRLKNEEREDSLDNISPSVGLAWHVLDWLTFKSNYGESYRIPSSHEMAGYTPLYGGAIYHGDPDLKPEKGLGWDAGFEIDYKALTLSMTYFQTDYRDKIAAHSHKNGIDMQYYNIDGATEYRGLEGQAGLDFGEVFDWPFMLRLYGNITHMLKYETEDGTTAPNVRNTDLAYGLNFQYPSIGLEADLRFIYLGHQHEDDFVNSTGIIKTGGDTTADFFISKTVAEWEGAGSLSLKGAVYNIFDVEYSTIYGYPMPGRSFYCGLRYDY